MKAARVLRFGPPNVITNEDVPKPEPGAGQLLVRVKAAGVGHWDALIREGKVQLQPLPLTLGSELSGIIEGIGADVSGFELGDEVYGATNEQFGGAYAEYAVPSARRMAPKPKTLSFIEAASVPIVTVTAWQMLFEYAHVTAGQTVLIHGGSGGVGHLAIQIAKAFGARVIATASTANQDFIRRMGADVAIDYTKTKFEEVAKDVDVVLDMAGGDTLKRSYGVVKKGGIIVSIVDEVDQKELDARGIRGVEFRSSPKASVLEDLTRLIDAKKITPIVSQMFPLSEVARAQEQISTRHTRGKIVFQVADEPKG